MAKKKAAAKAAPAPATPPAQPFEEPQSPAGGGVVVTETKDAKAKGGKKGGKDKPAPDPVQPFGDALPRATEVGSPADKNWRPTGDQIQDIAALEAQESYLFAHMTMAKAERDVAKANSKLAHATAQQTRVTDGFSVEEMASRHRAAQTAERKAAKAEKEFKRHKDGFLAVVAMKHRYMLEDEPELFAAARKKK